MTTEHNTPAFTNLDFKGSLIIEPDSLQPLSGVDSASVERVVNAIGAWIQKVPVDSVKISAFTDPEAANWQETVIDIHVAANEDEAVLLWNNLSRTIDEAKKDLPESQKDLLNSHLGISLSW